MPMQMRLSPNDNRFYSPDRDLAYCTPHLVMRAMRGLEPENMEPWIADYMKEHGLTVDQLGEGAGALARYLNEALTDPQYAHPFEALKAAGFFDLPQPVQNIICMKIGQVFISAFFSSIRDVTRDPKDPPMDAKAIAETAAEVQAKIRDSVKPKNEKRGFLTPWF